ncbi:MAG: DUF4349 domain-containing protein [Gemmatimonadaceae bacterium]
MRHHLVRLAAPLALALAAAGCTHAAATTSSRPDAPAGPGRVPIRRDAPEVVGGRPGAVAVRADRMVFRRGSISMEVVDLLRARDAAERLTTRAGGYVRATSFSDRDASLTLHIPAAAFDATVDSIARLGRVTHRTMVTDDVTELVVDTEARVANLRALRDRLRQLLERATSVADVIDVERELARVQSELESLESRLKTVRSSVALSELHVALHQPPSRASRVWRVVGVVALVAALGALGAATQ